MSKLIALVLCVAVCLGLLTGCAQQNAGGGNSGESNPFFFVTPETTEEDFIRQFGEPDDTAGSEMKYENFEAFGFTGTMWARFYSVADVEIGFYYTYPGAQNPDADYDGDIYPATDSELQEKRSRWKSVYDELCDRYGEPTKTSDGEVMWEISEYLIGMSGEKCYIVICDGYSEKAIEIFLKMRLK